MHGLWYRPCGEPLMQPPWDNRQRDGGPNQYPPEKQERGGNEGARRGDDEARTCEDAQAQFGEVERARRRVCPKETARRFGPRERARAEREQIHRGGHHDGEGSDGDQPSHLITRAPALVRITWACAADASMSGGGSALPRSEASMPDVAPADIRDFVGRTPDSVAARRLRRASDQLFRLWSAMMTMTKAATPTIPATALAVFTGLGAPPKISGVG